jgi:hypothetical protein
VAARPLPGVVAVRARRVLFMAFLCSSWPFPMRRILTGNDAGKNAYFVLTRANYSKMWQKICNLGLDYSKMCL